MTTNSPLILIVTRPQGLAFAIACRRVLEMDGYRVISASTLGAAVSLALKQSVKLIVIGNSFTETEQEAFIECLHETHAHIHVICVRRSIAPLVLLDGCKSVLAAQPGAVKVHQLGYRRAS